MILHGRSMDLRKYRIVMLALLALGLAHGADAHGFAASDASSQSSQSSMYVKVQIDPHVKLSKLKPGDEVEGKLSRDVYSDAQKLFSAGSQIRVVVDQMLKRPRQRNDHWPWVVNAFTPRHEKYPVFKTATVSGPEGDAALQVSVL